MGGNRGKEEGLGLQRVGMTTGKPPASLSPFPWWQSGGAVRSWKELIGTSVHSMWVTWAKKGLIWRGKWKTSWDHRKRGHWRDLSSIPKPNHPTLLLLPPKLLSSKALLRCEYLCEACRLPGLSLSCKKVNSSQNVFNVFSYNYLSKWLPPTPYTHTHTHTHSEFFKDKNLGSSMVIKSIGSKVKLFWFKSYLHPHSL